MRRFITFSTRQPLTRNLSFVAAMLLAAAIASPAEAQTHMGIRGGGGFGGVRARPLGVFGGGTSITTVFDLYRTGQIPVPPYYALHPPVYYGQREFQSYGRTPFAFPYTWWQQGASGYPAFGGLLAQPNLSASAPAPLVVSNPYTTADTATADSSVIDNPYMQEASSVARGSPQTAGTSKMILNPYYEANVELAQSSE